MRPYLSAKLDNTPSFSSLGLILQLDKNSLNTCFTCSGNNVLSAPSPLRASNFSSKYFLFLATKNNASSYSGLFSHAREELKLFFATSQTFCYHTLELLMDNGVVLSVEESFEEFLQNPPAVLKSYLLLGESNRFLWKNAKDKRSFS